MSNEPLTSAATLMSQQSIGPDQARHELYSIIRGELPFEEKAELALAIGEKYLDVDNAHLTHIHPDSDYWKAIVSTDSVDGTYPPGLILDLSTTYCRHTIAAGESIAISDAASEGWADDPAFEEHGLDCYHGTPISLDDETWGTVCFISDEARSESFSTDETMFAELIARMLEHELQWERTQEKLERMDQFASVLSHDLRNPLTIARGHIDLARQDSDNEDLAVVEEAIDRMVTIISDVLTMARQGHEVEETESIKLSSVTQQSWRSVATAEATLSIEAELEFMADPDRSRHLFENLFRNAVEHTRSDVTVTVGGLSDGDGFFVEDDGPGIPADRHDTIFDAGVSTGSDGLGIGLSIVEGVATAHGWDIRVTDGSDGGARFEFTDVVTNQSG